MTITRQIFESYCKCRFKAQLELLKEPGIPHDYERLVEEVRHDFKPVAVEFLLRRNGLGSPESFKCVDTSNLTRGLQLIVGAAVHHSGFAFQFDALERVDGESLLGSFHYSPVIFNVNGAVRQEHRLLIAFGARVIGELQGRIPDCGLVISSPDCKLTRVQTDKYWSKSQQLIDELLAVETNQLDVKLRLNTNCDVCCFRSRCRTEAFKKDDLSLIRSMTPAQVERENKKGIFTVTQLSYTYRPRRKGKRVKQRSPKYRHSLHALAIREKTVYVFQKPSIANTLIRIYLDLEGNADGSIVYLMGIMISDNQSVTHHSCWIDDSSQDATLVDFLYTTLSHYDDYHLFHFGSYEANFLRRMKRRGLRVTFLDSLLKRAVNLLSMIYGFVYFPTFSHSLKDIAGCLAHQWSQPEASGLQSLVWRRQWEKRRDNHVKQLLITYNEEDCDALRKTVLFLDSICSESRERLEDNETDVVYVEDMFSPSSHLKLGSNNFVLSELERINECAYFDYQRVKIVGRVDRRIKKAFTRRTKRKARRFQANKRIELTSRKCPHCGERNLSRYSAHSAEKYVLDLRVTSGGVRRNVTKIIAVLHRCKDCGKMFRPPQFKKKLKIEYGATLKKWVMYQHVQHKMPFKDLEKLCRDLFGLRVPLVQLHRFKGAVARFYRQTYKTLLENIISGNLLHLDETIARLKKERGYVWVFTNMKDVAYMYRDTREGQFLHELLATFEGVLVTDFYSAYDSIDCAQQKCLVHLTRDLNDELAVNFHDSELRQMIEAFGKLMVGIVSTIDRHGLNRKHFGRHRQAVDRFYLDYCERSCGSDVAEKYRKRFVKNKGKLFLFLQHDGVPWNNNNAEHAIKHFAKYRVISDGHMTESGISDYLILLSIHQSCMYRGVSFLRFLLSGKDDIEAFAQTASARSKKGEW